MRIKAILAQLRADESKIGFLKCIRHSPAFDIVAEAGAGGPVRVRRVDAGRPLAACELHRAQRGPGRSGGAVAASKVRY